MSGEIRVSKRMSECEPREDKLCYDPRIHRVSVVNGDQERFYSSVLTIDQQAREDYSI